MAYRNFPPHLQSVEYGEGAGEQVQLGQCHGQVQRDILYIHTFCTCSIYLHHDLVTHEPSQKGVVFRVTDSTVTSEFGPGSSTAESGSRLFPTIPGEGSYIKLIHTYIMWIYIVTLHGFLVSIVLVDEESGRGSGLAMEALAVQSNLTLNIDIYRIEQVIRNLITNAVRIVYVCNKLCISM